MSSPSPSKAPDDPGAFGMLSPNQERILKGASYRLTALIAKEEREPNDWSFSFFLDIHKRLFEGIDSDRAGKLRLTEVTFRSHAIPTPEQIQYRLMDVVRDAKRIIEDARTIDDDEQRIEAIFPRIACLHAECVVIQPFIDGNKRWARQVLSALLVDCGFWPGARIEADHQKRYMDGIDKSVAGDHEQLATLILEGWQQLASDFSSGMF
jgi:fido (protein-threonine AMPylation protein)